MDEEPRAASRALAPRTLFLAWPLAAGAGFLALALYGTGPTSSVEIELTRAVQAADPAPARWSAEFMTALGNEPWFSLLAFSAVAAIFFWARRPSLAAFLAVAVGLRALSPVLKAIVDRPRPDAQVVEVASTLGSPSYPSGHVLGATLLFGFAMYCAERTIAAVPLRRAVQGGLLALIVLMGHARVELGHHWPSDVLGGWLVGALLVAALIWAHRRWERPAQVDAVAAADDLERSMS